MEKKKRILRPIKMSFSIENEKFTPKIEIVRRGDQLKLYSIVWTTRQLIEQTFGFKPLILSCISFNSKSLKWKSFNFSSSHMCLSTSAHILLLSSLQQAYLFHSSSFLLCIGFRTFRACRSLLAWRRGEDFITQNILISGWINMEFIV